MSLASFAEAGEELAHFAGGMKLVLLAGDFDPVAEHRASFSDTVELDQKLRTTEKRVNMRWLIGAEAAEKREAFFGAIFVVVFAGETVPQELVLWLFLEHRFDFFTAGRHTSQL